jgi:hypothetical protein
MHLLVPILTLLTTLPRPSAAQNFSFPSSTQGDTNPFTYPLTNGFPTINFSSESYTALLATAHGSGPKSRPPPTLSPASLPSLQLLAFHHLYSVAFYTSLLHNLTTNSSPYFIPSATTHATLVAALTSIQAQEQLHFLTSNGALKVYDGGKGVAPCKYRFSSTDLGSALQLAERFTDLVVGTLQAVQTGFGESGDSGLIGIVGSMGGTKAGQNGFLRALRSAGSGEGEGEEVLIPSALPFPTGGATAWLYSWLMQNVVVPGSCLPGEVDLPVFQELRLVGPTPRSAVNATLGFEIEESVVGNGNNGAEGLFIVYVNSQNEPVVVEAEFEVASSGGWRARNASFPAGGYLMSGLTIAVLSRSAGPFTSLEAVVNATLAGPALIEIG